jgi:DNA invertase Pin-like site-specific DNA recombinase
MNSTELVLIDSGDPLHNRNMKSTKRAAFAYLRVSGKGQLEGDGFTRQIDTMTKYAKANQISITQTFEERGVSGTNDLDDRPALQDLIAALHANGTKIVMIEKLDRLARDLMIQETILADLRKSGFEVISVQEPDLCSDDPSRVLVRQIFGAIAQYDRAMTVLKLRAARQRMRTRLGKCEGRKPFGHRPGERATMLRLHTLRTEGLSYEAIAKTLDEEGLKPRKADKWNPITVNRVLAADTNRMVKDAIDTGERSIRRRISQTAVMKAGPEVFGA